MTNPHSHNSQANRVESFTAERAAYNEIVTQYANTDIKRFYGIDANAYKAGALDEKTKELLGFVASLVLRCDDCILYHAIGCHKAGVTSEEFMEAISIGMLVGGSITIPHMRRVVKIWHEELGGTGAAQAA